VGWLTLSDTNPKPSYPALFLPQEYTDLLFSTAIIYSYPVEK